MSKNKITFPKSFIKKPHPFGFGYQWKLMDGENVLISIVGGDRGLYGDGITTFEMWDYNEEQPRGYLSKKEINEHLNKYFNS